jgi:hypothetical protein
LDDRTTASPSPAKAKFLEYFLRVWAICGVQLNVGEDLSDSELREKLAAWQVEGQLPRDFQQQVWKRIAMCEAVNVDPPWLIWLKSLLMSVGRVSIPRLALTAVVVGLLIGTTTGVIEASRWNSATWNRLESKYVQSIDPYQRIPSS